jgi:hypothetical protein
MIPSKSDGKWAKLVTGEISIKFKVLSAGLLMSRMQRETKATPDSLTVRRCVDEVYAFFEKFEGILQEDIAKIFGQEG